MSSIQNNPIFQRLTRRERDRTAPIFAFVALGLATATVVGVIWMHILDYPEEFVGLLTVLACIIGPFLTAIILSVTSIIVRRQTRAQSYQLLYMTNVSDVRMVWGTFWGMVMRLRVWLMLLAWVGAVGMTGLAYEYDIDVNSEIDYPNPRIGAAFRALRVLPAPLTVVFYGAVASAFMAFIAVLVVAQGVRSGFQRQDPVWATTRGLGSVLVLVLLLGSINIVLMVALETPLWFVAMGAVLAAITLGTAWVARRWQLPPLFAPQIMADQLATTMLAWGVLATLLSVFVFSELLVFLLLYGVYMQIITGWWRLHRNDSFATVFAVHNLSHIITIFAIQVVAAETFSGPADVNLSIILPVGVFFWALCTLLIVAVVWVQGAAIRALRLMGGHLIVYNIVALLAWALVTRPTGLSYPLLLTLLLLPIIGGFGWSFYAQRGKTGGLIALVLLCLHLLLIPAVVVWQLEVYEPLEQGVVALGVWALVLVPYSLLLRNLMGSFRHVWKQPIG